MNNADCKWTITAPEDFGLEIVPVYFDLECGFDTLTLTWENSGDQLEDPNVPGELHSMYNTKYVHFQI